MTILQQPDALSLSGNIKDFRISTPGKISFVLLQGATEILSQSYDPGQDGLVTISLKDIIHSCLSFRLQESSQVYLQPTLADTFTARFSDEYVVNPDISGDPVYTDITFRAVRAGIDRFADTATNFLTQNFLTWQPTVKPVTYYSPEFLTYYAVVPCIVKLRAYFTDDSGSVITQKDITLSDFEAGKAYTIPLQYASVAGKLDNELPGYYDVWIENTEGVRLTYIQRYYASDMLSEQEQWILFENSLGGIDTFRAYGSCDFTGEHTHNIAEIEDNSLEYRVDTERKFQKNTGHLNAQERRWLLDFFPSLSKYIYTGSYLRPIVVTESNVTYTDRELPSNYTFTYKYADARPFLNIPRTEPAGDLNITVPGVGSFTVPPRLVEFPRLPLTEGALFPVQDPYSEKWYTATSGSLSDFIANRLSENYDGNGGIGHQHDNFDLLQLLTYTAEYLLVAGKKIKAGYAEESYTFCDNMSQELITFLKGARYGTWSQGSTGAAIYQDVDGNWHFEADFMNIRKKLTATEIEIMKMSHIGGALMLTGASMRCIKVEETADAYRCFMRLEDADGRTIYNQWKVGDQAFVETFNLTRQADGTLGNHYLWRLVTAVGTDYIDLSKTIAAAGSDIPLVDDDIVLLGYQGTDDPDRQNASIIAGAGVGSPFLKQYTGIASFTLPEEETRLKPGDNKVTGRLHIQPGSTGYDNIEGLTDKFNSLVTGAVNLLLNTGFTGDYQSIDLSANTPIDSSTQLYSQQTKHWTVSGVTIQEDLVSKSGYAAVIGLLAQSVELTEGENYILSFRAKGTSLTAVCGSLNETIAVTTEYERFVLKFTASQATSVVFNGVATICEIMLERGTIASEWRASYLDNDKSFAEFKAYQYIISAMKNASSDTIGGLFLTNMLMVGNYKDGVMQKVTGGKSGIYNSDDDVSDWGGGTYEQAVYTAMKYLQNPSLEATEEELSLMCKWLATHGGRFILNDAIVRGVIYANGGVFRGGVYAQYGEFAGFIKTSYQTWPVGETVIDLSKGAHWIVKPQSAGLTLYLPTASPANEGTDVRLFNSFILTRSSYEFVLRIQDNETFFYPKFEPIIDTHYKAVIVNSQEIILRSIYNQWYIVNYKDFVSTDFLTE